MRVLVHGKPMPRVRARSTEWLLALLVPRHGRTVKRSWLAGTLWPDSQETQALQNLRHALLSLRKALEPEGWRFQSPTRDTLTLDLSDVVTDVLEFDQAIQNGEEESLRRAVGINSGPLLEGCLEEWVFPERVSREQDCLRALEMLAAAAEQRQDYTEALALLNRTAGMDALRDTTQRSLMRVLAACGDSPAALASYRAYHLLLHEQMNVEPDEETVRLYRQISQQPQQIAQRPGSTAQEARPSRDSTPAALVLPAALPHPLTSLIGREQEIRDITRALSRSRLVTLVGGGGVGKTRLAIQVAREHTSNPRQTVAFVELATLTDPALLPTFVAAVLGIREEARPEPVSVLQALTDWFSTHAGLLVLDNCEHLIDAAASLTQTLLERCPDLRILTTSRQRLGMIGEITWRVPSLPVPDVEHLPADSAEAKAAALAFPAIRLFAERASSADKEFHLNRREDIEAICRICYRLDGIPLAIELAAARVGSLTVEAIYGKLDQRFRLLTSGSRTALPRQQTLRSLIDWSYDLLNESEKALLYRLSVFSGGWTLEAAEAVASVGDEGRGMRDENESLPLQPTLNSQPSAVTSSSSLSPFISSLDVEELLTSLVDKSLVVVDTSGSSVRYRLLETVRQYAREKLTDYGNADEVRQRHVRFYLDLAEEAARHLRGPEQSVWLQRLESDHDNLRTVLEGDDKIANLRMAGALWRFWFVRGHLSEGRARLSEAISQARQAEGQGGKNDVSRATALHGAGTLASAQGDDASARRLLEESLAIRRELGDQRGMADSLVNLGIVAHSLADYTSAQILHEESLAIRRELGDKGGIANSLANLGNVAYSQGDYTASRSLHEEGLALHRELGNRGGIANSLGNLGDVAYAQGDNISAKALNEESLAIRRELGDRGGTADALGNLGDVAYSQSDYIIARTLYEESLAIQRDLGDKGGIAYSLECLSAVAAAQGQTDYAVRVWGAASALRDATGSYLPPNELEEYNRQVATARQILDEEAFLTAWEQGRTMKIDQAIRFALTGTLE